ncbi:Hypothetical_protein [Hexamita inflata]|uniref:Hypothetical_protein n=1 Tax=Hexamita inflata TaxID=28002 RepID=A0AA86U760_9EUKA|nr:Hypothetical protein HINF_LOCUS28037 [Hexamita inflata]CAI9940395.1 Hypothetical protein HINF_LOCUS28040 [Hexamita inflata]
MNTNQSTVSLPFLQEIELFLQNLQGNRNHFAGKARLQLQAAACCFAGNIILQLLGTNIVIILLIFLYNTQNCMIIMLINRQYTVLLFMSRDCSMGVLQIYFSKPFMLE